MNNIAANAAASAAGDAAFDRKDSKLVLAHLFFAYAALLLGGICGMLQGMVRSGSVTLPGGIGYYQLLTAHGVLMALVFTTFFIIGFLYSGLSKTLGGKLLPAARQMGWIGFVLMGVGTIIATMMILLNEATVLYTFYAPMKASPWFYIGLALLVVGSWVSGFGMFHQYRKWKQEHNGKLSPLFAFMTIATMILWLIATLGVAVIVLFQFIPWSFGWIETIHVMFTRTLFWYFGHPLVYFWLLPAYACWYVMIPKIIGGKVFSDSMARLAFCLFIIFSIPVGFHHQLLEPGIDQSWKFLQVILTFAVIVPSLMTAFAVFATFEQTMRAKGAKGLFGWFKALPWGDVRFLAPVIGAFAFIPGGAGGIINASNQLNVVIHNTLWVTGHFHLTVATTVAMTFFGITYWLIPAMTGRTLTPRINKLGVIQNVIWAIGMLIMSAAMHIVGLDGAPRRTAFTTYSEHADAMGWMWYYAAMAIGGVIVFISLIMLIYNIFALMRAPKGYEEYPIAESAEAEERTPKILENWKVWIGIVAALILIAYATPVAEMLINPTPGSTPWVTW